MFPSPSLYVHQWAVGDAIWPTPSFSHGRVPLPNLDFPSGCPPVDHSTSPPLPICEYNDQVHGDPQKSFLYCDALIPVCLQIPFPRDSAVLRASGGQDAYPGPVFPHLTLEKEK